MNCIKRYLVTTKEERKALSLARKIARREGIYYSEDREFFNLRYSSMLEFRSRVEAEYARDPKGFFWNNFNKEEREARRNATRELIAEVREIQGRELSPRNMARNFGVLSLNTLVGGFINFVGAFGGGVRYVPGEDMYKPNYKMSGENT